MKQISYEKAIKRLEEIVDSLENSELTLDESLKLFEEGVKLTAFCNKYLETAKQRIVKLSEVQELKEDDYE